MGSEAKFEFCTETKEAHTSIRDMYSKMYVDDAVIIKYLINGMGEGK
ncbi:hypothetical protein U9K47_32115 [Bacillus toyonensis]|nr:hypothetical protein [Bacillus toyonensis]EEL34545.1 hypothetical protein bcere0019_22230 [Bacillus cereus Rock3-28]MBJ7949860.1 hypothetical protein [Bacillus cereus group sp. N24]UKS62541.1 hypothetical protein K6T24_11825 [Bacillus toyonensis]